METASDISPTEHTLLKGNASSEEESFYRNRSSSDEETLDGNSTSSYEQIPYREQILQDVITEVSLEEVVQVICFAWRQHREPKDRTIDYRMSKESKAGYDFFNLKEAFAMRLAWQELIRHKYCASGPHIIGEAIGTAIAQELFPVPQCDENGTDGDFQLQFAIKKNIITSNFLEYWDAFEDRHDEVSYLFPRRYIETIFHYSGLRPVQTRTWMQLVERYDKVHDFFMKPKLQLFLHSLLLIWHISFLIIGSKYIDCPTGHFLPPVIISVGCVGGFATLFRLALMYLSQGQFPIDNVWKWRCLRLTELAFLILFFYQVFLSFYFNAKTEPDSSQCVQDFYNTALMINYVSIPLASVYVIAYSIVICAINFDFWRWVFKRL